ncbi:D-alanyl-D-alanine carboxypeptidase family protein [Alkalicoccus halolimnae]|uniref:serine-type D-Ala-D-Ala carboxypeptidase n=1 Tax=Alkalicoccus halolimnae TaxID=1667239 RepID=A0A5C7FBG0_9BACI|nr:D-alanyl-D-alanine carboxypeptidase family protein [Alkalicoccus halolimnae]TXF81540.1 D-alanyl-D-alanine carboxypeptidase [Alkalicoccus halolimnae]
MIRKTGIAAAGTIILAGIFSSALPAAAYEPSVDTVILADAETGEVLYEQNSEVPLPPASMTKMMTEYLILEAVENGDISWDDQVSVNDFLASLSHNRSLSNVMMRTDETYTVEELYESVAIYSANASAMALTEHISGSEGAFVEMMNERGKEIGMGDLLREEGAEENMENLEEIAAAELGDFQFVNSTGLPNRLLEGSHPEGTSEEEDNYMSARASATLAYHLVKDYPEVLDSASIPQQAFREGSADEILMQNWNWMLEGTQYEDLDYEYVDGLKTGYTEAAGFTFTGTAEKDGQRFVSVVMGADSEAHRFRETEEIMEWAFDNFQEEEIFPGNMTLDSHETVPVSKGEEEETAVVTAESVSKMTMDGGEDSYSYRVELDEELLNEDGELEAPVEEGDVVGEMVVEYDGERDISYLGEQENTSVDIVAAESVERAGFFSLTMRNISSFFSGLF